jgi:hypothetical protein
MPQQFRFNPMSDCLRYLRLLSDVLVVAVLDHCRVHSAWTTRKALNRGLQQRQFLLTTDVVFRAEEGQDRTVTRVTAGFGVCVPKKSLYSRGVVQISTYVAALMKDGNERFGSRSKSSPAPS